MDYPKFIVSNQKEESISIQRVKKYIISTISDPCCIGQLFACLFIIMWNFQINSFQTLINFLKKNSLKNMIFSNSLDPDQARHFDLGPNFLQRLSAHNKKLPLAGKAHPNLVHVQKHIFTDKAS